MNTEKILEIYYDHYKETCLLNKEAQTRRNKSFILLCVLEMLSFLMINNPDFIYSLLNDVVKAKLETSIRFSTIIFQTVLWILLTYILIRYVQDVLYVEKQYRYLNRLEKKIENLLGEQGIDYIFCREGVGYKNEYPMVLNIIDMFYKMFLPLLFTTINIVRIKIEWDVKTPCIALWCDSVICFAIFIITWFYFFNIHSKITGWFMKCPLIERLASLLQKIMKEV